MKIVFTILLAFGLSFSGIFAVFRDALGASNPALSAGPSAPQTITGFRDSAAERALESRFLAIPSPQKAEEYLRALTQAPHMAGTPEDRVTADYVAKLFRAAGLQTEIEEYKVWMNYPREVSLDISAPGGFHSHAPTREHVEGDPYQNDPRIVMPFNSMAPTGDVEGEVVYANYGTPDDFKKLAEMKIDVRGKIVLMRYGQNFRGVKVLDAQSNGAAGVVLYSDPYDDGWRNGDKYPQGPWRPDTGVQRGSVGFMFEFPGDPTTPGIASVPNLPQTQRTPPAQSAALPKIPSTPISYADAWPILERLAGPDSPREWQGSLPFTYHVGPGPVRVKMRLRQDYAYRSIWNVIGRIKGSEYPDEWVVAGNHRDAWVYGAADPGSGTAAMLEAVRGIGELLKNGWRPKRTIVFASWDAEEEGLIGSTEWAEQHSHELAHAAAYFNMDVGVTGPNFEASSVPSLRTFLVEVSQSVPSPKGSTVYEQWQRSARRSSEPPPLQNAENQEPAGKTPVSIANLGSGSDYSVFLQHLGVPATDISSSGPYGVYHSAFDDFQWFTKFADPDFAYEQEMAGFFGLQAIRMADADVLPYNYAEYGKAILSYLKAAQKKADASFGAQTPSFADAFAAANRFEQAGEAILERQSALPPNPATLNRTLLATERALLIAQGLPHRPWFHHSIYAPGEYTGYAAVVIPGINEAIDEDKNDRFGATKGNHDLAPLRQQLAALTTALTHAAEVLQSAR